MNAIVIEDAPGGMFKRPGRLYTETNRGKTVVELQFQHGWGRIKWWRTYFVSEVTWETTVALVKDRLVKNAVRLGL